MLTRVIHTALLPAPVVDLRHDFLGPLNARSDYLVRSWASLQPARQIIGGLNISTHENRGHHTDDAFAPFVLLDILTCSSFVRLPTLRGGTCPLAIGAGLGRPVLPLRARGAASRPSFTHEQESAGSCHIPLFHALASKDASAFQVKVANGGSWDKRSADQTEKLTKLHSLDRRGSAIFHGNIFFPMPSVLS